MLDNPRNKSKLFIVTCTTDTTIYEFVTYYIFDG